MDTSKGHGKGRENMNRPTVIIITIILVSYSLFFYFQMSTEFRMKENLLNSALGQQLGDNSKLAAELEHSLTQVTGVLQAASQNGSRIVMGEGSSVFLQDTAEKLELGKAIVLVVSDSYTIIDSWTVDQTNQGTFNGQSLFETGLLLPPDQEQSAAISIGTVEDESVIFISYPLSGLQDTFVVAVIPTLEILPEIETADYEIYFSDQDLTNIQSLGRYERGSESAANGDSFAAAFRVATMDASSEEIKRPIVYAGQSEELMVTASLVTIGDHKYAFFVTSSVAEHLSASEEILFAQRIQTFSLLAGTSLITVILALFLSNNLRLDREVKARTMELVQSNVLINQQKEELEQANVQLRQLDTLKDRFISIASHELKNPIQPILMYAELAKRGNVSVESALDGIAAEARRLKKLANDILDVSRLESGGLKYTIERTKLKPIIDQIVSSARISVPKDVRIAASMDNEEVEIDADIDRITQVLHNIVSNAVKFTTAGSIDIRVNKDQGADTIVIKISDTGGGIPKEILPSLFEKFATRSVAGKNTDGTGLGLYISKAIVAAHGGTIVAANNPGVGATFTITLPAHSPTSMGSASFGVDPQRSQTLAG